MPNPGGGNQFGSYELQPKYGDVSRFTQLTKEAPVSGAPRAAQALNAPRRSQRSAARGQQAGAQAPPQVPQGAPQIPPEKLYAAIAEQPGASDTVRQIFGG